MDFFKLVYLTAFCMTRVSSWRYLQTSDNSIVSQLYIFVCFLQSTIHGTWLHIQLIVQWNKGILKLVILISWQLEKFTCQAKVQILWVQLVKNKTSFFFIQLIYYSQYSRSFVSNPCEPAGKYLQLPSRNLKDRGPYLWYVQKQPPKRVLITSQ